jgi:hypothetical protein
MTAIARSTQIKSGYINSDNIKNKTTINTTEAQ